MLVGFLIHTGLSSRSLELFCGLPVFIVFSVLLFSLIIFLVLRFTLISYNNSGQYTCSFSSLSLPHTYTVRRPFNHSLHCKIKTFLFYTNRSYKCTIRCWYLSHQTDITHFESQWTSKGLKTCNTYDNRYHVHKEAVYLLSLYSWHPLQALFG